MRIRLTWLIVAVLAAITVSPSAQSNAGRTALEAARKMEVVDGNLKGAIEQYKKIAQSTDRAIAAKALVRMAVCYQKLGDAESRRTYERIVKEFSDQKEEATLARARLAGPAAGTRAKGDRAVWTGPKVDWFGRVSPDGRFITYVDWNDGRLMIHDVAANVDRALTPAAPNYSENAGWSAISKDGKQVVYEWEGDHPESRIASLQGSGLVEPRRLNTGYFNSFDWSPDGKWIAATNLSADRTTAQIGVIAVADGSFRRLKSTGNPRSVLASRNNRTCVRFSPDGKYIAYDRPPTDTDQQHDVFVLAIDGSGEIPAVVHSADDRVMGWSPDGTRLLFSSDRTGSVGFWALPFADGKAQGSPELLKPDIGPSFSLGLTAAGTLYVHKTINTRDIAIAPIDIEAGKLLGPPERFTQGFVNGATGHPGWSRDGNYLAYLVPCQNRQCLAIRSVATGQVRLSSPMVRIAGSHWSPDGRSILARGTGVMGRDGYFQFDAQTGDVTAATLLSNESGLGVQLHWSPDGKIKVFLNRSDVFVERDLASGAEREVNRVVGLRGTGPLSPDGQYFAPIRQDPATKTASLLIVPVAGGQPRELLRLAQPEVFVMGPSPEWTADSRAVMVVKDIAARRELWLVPVAEGRPRKLDIDPDIWLKESVYGGQRFFSLSPDGRRIAFQMGKTVSEVWALENFLPTSTANKPTARK